ncbi:hypothetical protein BGW38_009272, partial [Lunasporangiospora selenospora]
MGSTSSMVGSGGASSIASKHTSLNGFSTPGALSQFIHPGPASPALQNGLSNNHYSGGGSNSISSNGGSISSSSFFKTHQKHASHHHSTASASGSLYSSPTVMSASVNAFNSGLGNPTSLTLNGASSHNRFGGGGGVMTSSTAGHNNSSGGIGSSDKDYDLEAALRASLKDMEAHGGAGGGSSGSSGPGSGVTSSSIRTPNNGSSLSFQHSAPSSSGSTNHGQSNASLGPQKQPVTQLGPKGMNSSSHLGVHVRGRGARR